ncbi:extracellular catalytic domain type 1 short-chain-length polyhydroxyalkanoate depolymerase [Noviherbaspirillum pedocola]|uniref:PHB depolymerase family esterase n=1 Tax=Noviherbaspirillum pedocola TaxID=2801341 RepID=A0A934T3S7_9BURK|nr:PHB depolymerase family esterase [Noviherbaspirillum pedocola]MBK4739244.1 PHB depolymerase family esterase [Noviherbaspirillum pedocola]
MIRTWSGKVYLAAFFMALLQAQQPAAAGEILTGSQVDADGGLTSPSVVPRSRGYFLYVPSTIGGTASNASPQKPVPLLVMLHGCLQTPESFAAGTRMNDLAEKNNFLVLYPKQDAVSSLGSRCWNWFDANTQHKKGEAAIIRHMVEKIASDYKIDRARIYVAGLSAGAALADILASCYPDIFAAAAIHSGMEYGAATNKAEAMVAMAKANGPSPDTAGRQAFECQGTPHPLMPVIVFQGGADPSVNPQNATQVIEQFAQTNDYADDGQDNDSVARTPTSQADYHSPPKHRYTIYDYRYDGQLLMRKVVVDNMKHAWSGGKRSAFDPYYDPHGPDASSMMWDFFSQHARQ